MSDEQKPPIRVTIVDVDIPFNSLVGLVIKCIPAIVVVAIFFGACLVALKMILSAIS